MAISTPALGSLFKLSRENTVRVECAAPSPLSRLNTDEKGGGEPQVIPHQSVLPSLSHTQTRAYLWCANASPGTLDY